MHTKEEFTSYALRLLIAVMSLVVMIPIAYETSLYVTALIFSFGQFIDVLGRVLLGRNKPLFICYIIAIFIGIVIIAMCICPWVNTNAGVDGEIYNPIIIGLSAILCLLNVAEFVIYLVKLYYTKIKLHHF